MKRSHAMAVVLIVLGAAAGGWFARSQLEPPALPRSSSSDAEPTPDGSGPCPGGAEALYWKAPMDPSYVRDAPGKSPMGMDLVPVCPEEGDSGEASGVSDVRIEPSLVQRMGVRIAPVERRSLGRTIRAVGRVTVDERRVSHVHTKIQGWIEKLHVEYEGEAVRKGAPLLEIYSPEMVATQEELLLAARYRDATKESPFGDVQSGGEQLLDATRRRLELWDIPRRDIDRLVESGTIRKTLTLYAPSSGVVTEMHARAGMEVDAGKNLYTIADLSRIWVIADVYENELPWISVGQSASVELSYLPDRIFEGEVGYVYPFLDSKTRTAKVRIELDNGEGILKPDMFANVTIQSEARADVAAVPEEAVIRSGRRTLVLVDRGEGRFEPRAIVLGLDSGDGWLEIREGLEPGERVVTSGQFLIDSESRLREAVQKLLAKDAE